MLNIPFNKTAKREECVLLKSPFQGDKRFAPPIAHDELFDLPPINIECLGGKRSTSIPKLEKYSYRPNHFRPRDADLPDSNVYQTEELNNTNNTLDVSG